MRRRLRLLILLALLGAAVVSFLVHLPAWSASLLAQSLTAFFHRPSTVATVRFHLWPLEVEIVDLRVSGITPDAPPFLEIPRARVMPSLTPLWAGEIVLSRVRLTGLKARINAPRGGGDDIPKMGGGRGGGPALRVGRLVIEDGEFFLDHKRIPLDLDLPDFRGRLTRRFGQTALRGRISFGPGGARFGTAPLLPFGTELDMRLEGARIIVENARLQAEGIDLAYRGQIQLGAHTQGHFTIAGPLDIDVLDRHVTRTGLGLRGASRFNGLISVDGSKLRIEGRLEGVGGAFDGIDVGRFAGAVVFDGDGLRIQQMEIEALGGSATLDVQVPSSSRPDRQIQVRGPLRGLDVEGLVRMIFDWGAFAVGSAATGEVEVSWPKGRSREISARLGLDLEARPGGGTPLSGRFEWSAVGGIQTVEKADLKTPETRAHLRGRIERDDRTALAVDAQSTDIAATDDLLRRLRKAMGNDQAEETGLGGAGVFRGRWRGTLGAPVFEGRFFGPDVRYRGVGWGHTEWVGTVEPDAVRSHSLVARRDGSELWVDGWMQTGFYAERDGLDVRVRLRDWPAADIVKALRFDLAVEGPVTGEAAYSGRRSALAGGGRLAVAKGRYYGIPFADLEATLRAKAGDNELSGGRARVGGGTVRFHGTVSQEGFYDGELEGEDVELGGLLPANAGGTALGGRINGRVTLSGPLARPRLEASLRSSRLFVGDEGLGRLEASLRGTGDGRLSVKAESRSSRVDLTLSGDLGAAPPYDAALRLEARETSIDPFLRAVAPALPSLAGIVATGSVDIRGPLTDPRKLQATANLSELLVLLPEYAMRSPRPLRATLAGGRLELEEAHLAGEETDLAVAGHAHLSADGPLELTLRGATDLRILQVLTGRVRGRGAARLLLEVAGTRAQPRAVGTLSLEGAGVRVRGFPQGVEDLRGTVRFTEASAEFGEVTGTLGGGNVTLEGQAAYSMAGLTSFDVAARGEALGLRYPEGLRSSIDADLRFFGDAARQWVTGTLDLRQALWSRRYDVASELLAVHRSAETGVGLGESVRYDLKLRAPGTFRIDNNLANLQARAELQVQGTGAAPVVVGRAEVERGRVFFQGQTYVIRRGTMDFANPQRIDPFFDIEAETRIRSYRVTLRVNGTLERITPTLTSDPPLSTVQILNLLAGADESAVGSLAQTQALGDRALLAATGAATLAAGRISEEMGLERGAERVFGLNRFSIDPSLVKGSATTPVARVTLGKRITPDLNVLYAQDLNGRQDRLVSIEYTLSDRFSLLLTWSDVEGLGGDIRLRQSR